MSRFHRVRPYHVADDAFGLPLVYDQKTAKLLPYLGTHEWGRTRDGSLWVPGPGGSMRRAIAGGSFNDPDLGELIRVPQYQINGAITKTTVALDSAYTFNSNNDAIAMRILLNQAKTLSAVYFYLTAGAGTQANINDIDFELRNDGAAGQLKPGATLHASGSVNPNTDGNAVFVGWHKIGSLSFAMSALTYYWVIIADADGGGTDFATILQAATTLWMSNNLSLHTMLAMATTNGWTTTATATNQRIVMVLEFSDGTVVGNALGATADPTSNQNRRGLYMSDGGHGRIAVWGALSEVEAAQHFSGLEGYLGSTLPGGTTVASGTSVLKSNSTTANGVVGFMFNSPLVIPAATPARVVYTFSAGAQRPRKHQIENANSYSSVLRKAKPGGSGWYYAEANGTTDWSNDDQDGSPSMVLLVKDQESFPVSLVNAQGLVGAAA